MEKYSKIFLEKTIKVWQPYFPSPLTLEDARKITEDMTAYYSTLLEIEKRNEK